MSVSETAGLVRIRLGAFLDPISFDLKNKGAKVNAPTNIVDILLLLLGLADIKIPESVEGEDFSELIKKPNIDIDRVALIMIHARLPAILNMPNIAQFV